MKFQRRLSEPHIIVMEEQLPGLSLRGKWWQRLTRPLYQPDFWASLLKLMTGSAEPMIEKRCDRQGQTYYTIYDPVTQQRSEFQSEAEVRTWLEQRYYQ